MVTGTAAKKNAKIKDIAHDLGLDANTVSAYIGGKKPLSGVVKAMFWYYFLYTMPLELKVKGLRMIPL